jgi:hypothetical protein
VSELQNRVGIGLQFLLKWGQMGLYEDNHCNVLIVSTITLSATLDAVFIWSGVGEGFIPPLSLSKRDCAVNPCKQRARELSIR